MLETGQAASAPLRILSLDGGGAKGFYTLGVLKEIEAMVGGELHKKFDIVFGTSTGAIIAALIALGYNIDSILGMYRKHVPAVMSQKTASAKSAELKKLANEIFGNATFSDVKTGVGIVTAKWMTERPMIFKGSVLQAHGRKNTFVPGFGVNIADAVKASCSAYPFLSALQLEPRVVRTSNFSMAAIARTIQLFTQSQMLYRPSNTSVRTSEL
ncbi:patatin-like phospholipase family protein [Pseudomonas sp. KNUC1026]|uniref:patatin-like phospholipase family protein n=1 Tax=Pseudomonas sp. KNUC1026 TaxID=2893890 RepID=UPI001F2B1F8B|nr:patatin-like phospholipase family protein [Pseudomonas sp. KNUC1026]UFH50438.1 patatin-like phospholipase family protein [Pseudomonas sp. KNUC1026]